MSFETLKRMRWLAPGIVALLVFLPLAILLGIQKLGTPWIFSAIGPLFALVFSFVYGAIGLRDGLWIREQSRFVGAQIKAAILDLAPRDLQLSERERQHLQDHEIWKTISGVFWETVDDDDRLRSLKPHFYSNGFYYSTSFDILIISVIGVPLYTVSAIVAHSWQYWMCTAVMVAIALLAKFVFIPHLRSNHLKLSAEQLDLLKRRQGDAVGRRIRDVVYSLRGVA